jgi:hypothetical protein
MSSNYPLRQQRRFTPAEKLVIDRGYKINVEEGRGFTYLDFPEYRHGTLRNIFAKLRREGVIHRVYRSTEAYYAVVGTDVKPVPKDVTPKPMGVWLLLGSLLEGDDSIHDIRLVFDAPGFYEALVGRGWRPEAVNGDVALKPLEFGKGRVCKVRVHRSGRVSVMVGCSGSPFSVRADYQELLFILDEVRYSLEYNYTSSPIKIPPIGSWSVVQLHFGVDGDREFSGPAFNLTFRDLSNYLVRFYSKEVGEGRLRPRLERAESPRKPLRDLLSELLDKKREFR